MAVMKHELKHAGMSFAPTDLELVDYYLRRRLSGIRSDLIPDIDVYKYSPWNLPAHLFAHSTEMYFFAWRRRCASKNSSKIRTRRTVDERGGYWDCHAKERPIRKQVDDEGNNSSRDQQQQRKGVVIVIGSRVELSFKIMSDAGSKKMNTPWIMHEYSLLLDNKFDDDEQQLVVCKIYKKIRKDVGRCSRDIQGSMNLNSTRSKKQWMIVDDAAAALKKP